MAKKVSMKKKLDAPKTSMECVSVFVYFFLFLNRVFTFFTIVLIVTAELVAVDDECLNGALAMADIELSSLLLPILMRGSSGIFFDFLWCADEAAAAATELCDAVVGMAGAVATRPSDLNLACDGAVENDFDFVC